MYQGVPIALYLQGLSLLIGLVAVAIPIEIAVAGFWASRRISNRIEGIAADLDEAIDRISDLERDRPSGRKNQG